MATALYLLGLVILMNVNISTPILPDGMSERKESLNIHFHDYDDKFAREIDGPNKMDYKAKEGISNGVVDYNKRPVEMNNGIYSRDYQRFASTKQQNLPNIKELNIADHVKTLEERIKILEKSLKSFPDVPTLNYKERKRILIVGGAGFVGSHLVDRLMMSGHEITVADNFFTGRKRNIEHWIGHPNFNLITHDIVNPLYIEVDEIYHLASPASPPHYMYNPVKTVKTNTLGTINLLGLAKRIKARLLLASTSEVYGDPSQHPQSETYRGNVNPIGPRSCYDEGKRVAETLCYAYAKQDNVDVRVARIFNTYGPRMHMNDGRVVSNIILQVLQNESITIYGKGDQTRSFQYVSDLVDGLISLMNSNYSQPVNLGNPHEITILEFAKFVKDFIPKSSSAIIYKPGLQDDPQRRCPDIARAKSILKWMPQVSLKEGILMTIHYFAKELRLNGFSSHEETSEGHIIDYDDYINNNHTEFRNNKL
ncbi:unnamed protein product [Gordionus sp. m RMFG-2023]